LHRRRRRSDREDLPRGQAGGARGGGAGSAGVRGGAPLARGGGRRRARHGRAGTAALRAAGAAPLARRGVGRLASLAGGTAAFGRGWRLRRGWPLRGGNWPLAPRVAPLGAGRALPAERPSAAVSEGAAGRPGGAPLSERGASTGWGGRRTRRRRGGSEFGAAPSGRPSRAGANAVAAARPRSEERRDARMGSAPDARAVPVTDRSAERAALRTPGGTPL